MNLDEAMKWIARERFIREHHDLISPWAYSPAQRKTRHNLRLQRQWDRHA
jgi:hypothetical protein